MAHNHSQSVAELRRESERTRAELSQTVETLKTKVIDTAEDIRHTVSPENIKAEVSGYVAEKSRHWLDNLKQQAMDNPMQTLAAGTAVALPVFKMIRSVPVPLLMIGAGLALASPKARGAIADKVSASLKTPDGGNVIDEARDMARGTWRSAKMQAEARIDATGAALIDKAAETRDAATQVTDDVRKRVAEFGDAARETLSSARENLSSTMTSAAEAARDTLETSRAKAAETFQTTRASAENMVRDNAALVGALGLAIGALIAASLPSTRAERDTLGPTSDALRKSAADAASENFEAVKKAAMTTTEQAAEKISEAGLGSKIGRTTEDAAEKLKTVADDAITTAFEPSQTGHR
jgi:ElaB/YqjD/DUF883 family membrane-anchored ribosome-binding protein